MIKRLMANTLVTAVMLTLIGCGFHLRGAIDLSDNVKVMTIEGINLQRGFGLDLKRGLISNGIVIVPQKQADSAVLKITKQSFDRRVLSVGSSAKVSEYELLGIVDFSVFDAKGKEIAASQRVQAQRDYQFDEDEVLGRESEEELLREQINRQLVQSMLRRIAAIK